MRNGIWASREAPTPSPPFRKRRSVSESEDRFQKEEIGFRKRRSVSERGDREIAADHKDSNRQRRMIVVTS
jgi:hypothetical protein